jgi:hypothetical protein
MVTNDRHDVAKKLIEQEINAILMTPTRVKETAAWDDTYYLHWLIDWESVRLRHQTNSQKFYFTIRI